MLDLHHQILPANGIRLSLYSAGPDFALFDTYKVHQARRRGVRRSGVLLRRTPFSKREPRLGRG